MLGALLALASAAFFGLNNAAIRRGVIKGSVLQAMSITVPLGVPMCFVFAAVFGGFAPMATWSLGSWLWLALAGVVHFVIGRYGNYRATQALGATLSTPVQQISVLVALLLAFAFLGETINTVNLVGIALVMVGPMLLVRRRKATSAAGRDKGFEPQYGPGLFWGAVSALCYGSSSVIVVLGLQEGGIAESLGGLLVSYIAATLVVFAWIAVLGGPKTLGPRNRNSTGWFLASALFVALSQVFRYGALAIAPVAIVVPIQRLSVMFRLLFNALLNSQHEVFDRWIVCSIVLSVIGAVALAGDTQTMLGWVGLGWADWLARPLF